jgi:hypothetical protein
MKQNKKVYAVLAIHKKGEVQLQEIDVTPFVVSSSLVNKEIGIIGVFPVFSNKKKAKKFAGKNEIMTFEIINREEK